MMINLRNIQLAKGKFIKIKPHETEFVMNSNPRAILENNLRNYVCVTKGDTITVQFNKKKYLIDVVECQPKDAISLTNVDVEVDFEKPLDYKEETEVGRFFSNIKISKNFFSNFYFLAKINKTKFSEFRRRK
jgi:ubiquitin fusion degradation protein 1